MPRVVQLVSDGAQMSSQAGTLGSLSLYFTAIIACECGCIAGDSVSAMRTGAVTLVSSDHPSAGLGR